MIDPDSAKDLDDLETFLAEYAEQEDLTATDFWDNWVSLVHRVEKRANAQNADPDLRARFKALLTQAKRQRGLGPEE